ncbi:unnamed protein product [Arabidopsis halleri]
MEFRGGEADPKSMISVTRSRRNKSIEARQNHQISDMFCLLIKKSNDTFYTSQR